MKNVVPSQLYRILMGAGVTHCRFMSVGETFAEAKYCGELAEMYYPHFSTRVSKQKGSLFRAPILTWRYCDH